METTKPSLKVLTAGRGATALLGLALIVLVTPGCRIIHRHRNADLAGPVNPGDSPDKILYEKSMNEIAHGRYDVARLTLQAMINTYPDSEYLAKAKLAIADSYYNEGGVSGLTQAESEYKDFITFFPTAPEAPEAQFRAGMAHFRLMAKFDRDQTEARLAEVEFKEFLLKYPESPLVHRVRGRLREVQEILAEGDFKIASFYYQKGVNPAARSRYQEILEKYPDFSRADEALWYLGQSLERLKKSPEAVPYYSRILTEHPLSARTGEAKERLTAMHQPIPRATRATLARARADALRRPRQGPIAKLSGAMSGSPDLSATRHGPVRLGPQKPAETEMAKAASSGAGASGPGNTVVVQPVSDASLNSGKAADPKPAPEARAGDSSQNPDAQKVTTPKDDAQNPPPPPEKKKGRLGFLKKIVKPF